MKEEIEDLIKTYERRSTDLTEMALASNTDVARARLLIKRNVYNQVIEDLKYLVKDEQDKA